MSKSPSVEVIEIRATATMDGSEGLLAVVFANSDGDMRPTLNGPVFLTPPLAPLQAAFMRYQQGYEITPHRHPSQIRMIEGPTSEVIVVMKGRLGVDLYTSEGQFERRVILSRGDLIILFSGGHGFDMVEDTEIIEIKQGPYDPHKDKVRFNGVSHAST